MLGRTRQVDLTIDELNTLLTKNTDNNIVDTVPEVMSVIAQLDTVYAPIQHTHQAEDISGLPTKTSQLQNDDYTVKDKHYVRTDNNYSMTDKAKVTGIEEGAQVNIIETVKVNTVALTPSNKAVDIHVPVKVSELSNDKGFITKSVDDLANYYLKKEIYTKDEVQKIVSAIKQFSFEIAPSLPTPSADTMYKIYLIPSPNSQTQNAKDEFITLQSDSQRDVYDWEQIGSTAIDLSNYYTSSQTDSAITAALNTALANYTTTSNLTTLLAAKANASEMSVVDGTGTDADKTTITLKTGTSATVLKSHQSLAGKQDLIDSSHKLSADLVDDTSTTNKFVTASDKTTWDNKYTKPQTGIPASDIEAGVIPVIPSNTSYFSNYSGVGIVPEDGIRAETIANAATMSINPDVLTLIDGTVGTATITLQVPNDSLAHVWDIMLTTDSTVNITLAMSNSATIKVPSGFAIGASADCEISVIGKGTKYYLRYGEFA